MSFLVCDQLFSFKAKTGSNTENHHGRKEIEQDFQYLIVLKLFFRKNFLAYIRTRLPYSSFPLCAFKPCWRNSYLMFTHDNSLSISFLWPRLSLRPRQTCKASASSQSWTSSTFLTSWKSCTVHKSFKLWRWSIRWRLSGLSQWQGRAVG